MKATLPTLIAIVEDKVVDVLMLRQALSRLPGWKTDLDVIAGGQAAMDYCSDVESEQVRHAHLTANCYVTKPSDLDTFLNLAEHFRRCYNSARSGNGSNLKQWPILNTALDSTR